MKFKNITITLLIIMTSFSSTLAYRCLPLNDKCSNMVVCCPGYTCSHTTNTCVARR
ncbi:hypothetical protein BDF21DRAFT_431728 [Thamnidium elegans]|nr:hypothetical protein BDF21DRAFT_431728 [Thamnidium elegans]